MSATLALMIAAALTGLVAVLTDRQPRSESRPAHYVSKPLATLLILLLALLAPADTGPGTRLLIILGLAASLIGDIWLMLPRDRFVLGLASFAVAQVCYIAAFGGTLASCPPLWTYIPYLAYAGAMSSLLWRDAEAMRLPVVVYALLLVSVAWLAGARWLQDGNTPALQGWIGALLFLTSDSLLAWNRFRRPIPNGAAWVLATYYLGQALIALSA